MNTLTIKIPPQLEDNIVQASAQEHLSKSELVKRALEAYLRQRKSTTHFVSALDQAGDLVGCFSGGPSDLSTNPEHLASFGRDCSGHLFLDTGPWVALHCQGDNYHEWAKSKLAQSPGPFFDVRGGRCRNLFSACA